MKEYYWILYGYLNYIDDYKNSDYLGREIDERWDIDNGKASVQSEADAIQLVLSEAKKLGFDGFIHDPDSLFSKTVEDTLLYKLHYKSDNNCASHTDCSICAENNFLCSRNPNGKINICIYLKIFLPRV
jgi:hypothetical protein